MTARRSWACAVAFQITSSADNEKLKETLTQFVKNQFYEQYDRLIIYVLTTKQKTYSGSGHKEIIQDKFVFDKKDDIKDYRDLLSIVNSFQIDKARRIEDILEANFGNRNAVLRCKCAENDFGAGVAYASA